MVSREEGKGQSCKGARDETELFTWLDILNFIKNQMQKIKININTHRTHSYDIFTCSFFQKHVKHENYRLIFYWQTSDMIPIF